MKKTLWFFLAALLAVSVLAPQAHAAFGYRMPITINKSKVSSTQNNFPVLISITSANLKHKSYVGGHVENANGYDIVFRASDGTSALPHEVESYIAASGQLTAWVKVPSISSSADTLIYVYYGDSSISSPTATPASVWDSNFKAVYHLHSNENDSTSNNNHGVNQGSSNATGKIADGQSFSGSSYIRIPSSSSLLIDTNVTVSAWVKVSSFPGWMPFVTKPGGSRPSWKMQLTSGAQANFTTPYNYPSAGSLSTNTWYLITGVAQGSTRKIYINGSQAYTATDGGGLDPASQPMGIGGAYDPSVSAWNEFFTGSADEVRISNNARSAGWILTEYNNQSNPGTFHTLGAEQNIGAPVTYQIQAVAGSNGSISPSGTVTVNAGGNQVYTVTADSGYEVNQVMVDGAAVNLVAGQYTFSNVNANHTISASFSAVVVNPPAPPPVTVPGCGQNLNVHYGASGFDAASFNLISVGQTAQHTLQLNTGYFALDPNHIVIPFTQEVSVTFFYEYASFRNDFGWMLASEGKNGTKHPIYTDINDEDHDGVLDVFEPSSDVHVNRKVIGTFAGGTEIVFYLHVIPSYDGVPDGDPYDLFTKQDWNPDTYTSTRTAACSADSFTKLIHLGGNYTGGDCAWESNWMEGAAVDLVNTAFGLDFGSATASMPIVRNQKFPHVVVGVPANKPNEWVLGWEDLYGGGRHGLQRHALPHRAPNRRLCSTQDAGHPRPGGRLLHRGHGASLGPDSLPGED